MKIERLEPWNQVSYQSAMDEQVKRTAAGERGWLLFCCPPTITMGKRAVRGDVLLGEEERRRRGVTLCEVDRGGLVTFHGPGQIIGFPTGLLGDHVADPRGVRKFIVLLEKGLARFVEDESARRGAKIRTRTSNGGAQAGVWMEDGIVSRKIVSIGMRFSRDGIGHGFAMNVEPVSGFQWINPCGEKAVAMGSINPFVLSPAEFKLVVSRLSAVLPAFFTSVGDNSFT